VCRTDGLGDVLLSGPAVRAVASSGAHVTFLAGPAGEPAARRLPGVRDVIVHRLPWIDAEPQPVTQQQFDALVAHLTAGRFDHALILTSFHQNALPLALACRLAGIATVAAMSDDYPGSLLDVRHHVDDDVHEVERNLSLVAAAGFSAPVDDDGRLAITTALERRRGPGPGSGGYIVVHPGASVPARTLAPRRWRAVVAALAGTASKVVVTGGRADRTLTGFVTRGMPSRVCDMGGRTDFDTMAQLIAGADTIVVGNTGPAHLAAATGTPVVAIYAPTVPARRFRPWKVPHALLGDQTVECRDCRARVCPLAVQRCLDAVTPARVVAAVGHLASERRAIA
jgi:ADP-heptose:LPS heptosyltransferase